MIQPEQRSAASRIPSLALFALFVCALLLAMVAGVRAYDQLVARSDSADEERFSSGLIANSIKSLDSYGFIESRRGPEGNALILMEPTDAGVFETRIYEFEGQILLEYTAAEQPYDPTRATKLLDSEEFSFVIESGIISVTTDEGDTDIAIRSAGVGVS